MKEEDRKHLLLPAAAAAAVNVEYRSDCSNRRSKVAQQVIRSTIVVWPIKSNL
jgi:hypothetical protein